MLENFLAYKPLNALSARKVSEACSYKWKILKSLEAKNGSTKPGITTSITFPEWRVKILLDAFKSFTVSVYGLIDATFFSFIHIFLYFSIQNNCSIFFKKIMFRTNNNTTMNHPLDFIHFVSSEKIQLPVFFIRSQISTDLSSNYNDILIVFSCDCLTIIKLESLFMGWSPIINLVCFLVKRKKKEISINLLRRLIFII